MRISLCLMVYDELAGCQSVVPQLPRAAFDEVYAVDGGSRDGTVAYLESQGIPVHRQDRPSINAAYAAAVARCQTDALVVFFPKGTLDPACCLAVADKLREGFAMVVTSRDMPGARNEEDDKLLKPRKWGIRALSGFTSLVWRREGWRVRDVLHGVKGFTLDAFRRMRIADSGVTIDLEMVVRAYRLRLPRIELPVVETVRSYNHSRFPIWKTGKRLAWFLVRELFARAPAAVAPPGSATPAGSPAGTAALDPAVKPLSDGKSAG